VTKTEAAYLAAFLDQFGDRLSNDGCNDLFLPETDETRDMVCAAESYEPGSPRRRDGKLFTMNWLIVRHLQQKIMEEYDLTDKNLPKV